MNVATWLRGRENIIDAADRRRPEGPGAARSGIGASCAIAAMHGDVGPVRDQPLVTSTIERQQLVASSPSTWATAAPLRAQP